MYAATKGAAQARRTGLRAQTLNFDARPPPKGTLRPQTRPCARRAVPDGLSRGTLMRRSIFILFAATSVAAFSAATAASNNVEWTQHGGDPHEQRYSALNQVTVDTVG